MENEIANIDDIMQNTNEYKENLRQMQSVKDLTGEIEIQNINSIVQFGQGASENISKISDELLSSMKSVKSQEASEMLVALANIMNKFDIKEFESSQSKNIITKLFNSAKNTVDKLFEKYNSMGAEIEKVYVLLKKYENDIKDSNVKLKKLYDANIEFYKQLEQYIVAGEIAIDEIDMYINQFSQDETMSENEKNMMVQNLKISKDMLSQRIYDLMIAENIAMQSAPIINTMQMSNFNLIRKINTSFIITLPIFKQCLAQAIMIKRQEIQAKSIKMLDDKTNELIMKNAMNTSQQAVNISKLANTSVVDIQTLEKSYEVIMSGIQEAKAIQESESIKRIENAKKLETIKGKIKQDFTI